MGDGNASILSSKDKLYLCAICQDVATNQQFGVTSCDACKRFFMRIVQTNKQTKCRLNESCPIDKSTRSNCTYCRYDKCLREGMQPGLVPQLSGNQQQLVEHDASQSQKKKSNKKAAKLKSNEGLEQTTAKRKVVRQLQAGKF